MYPQWSLNDGMPLVQWACNGGDNQTWRVETASDGYSRVIALHSGKCLDVGGASTDDRAEIIQWQCHGGDNQQWRVEAVHRRLSTRGPSQWQVPGREGRIHERWRIHYSVVVSWRRESDLALAPGNHDRSSGSAGSAWLAKVTHQLIVRLQPESRTRGGRLGTAAAPRGVSDSVPQQPVVEGPGVVWHS